MQHDPVAAHRNIPVLKAANVNSSHGFGVHTHAVQRTDVPYGRRKFSPSAKSKSISRHSFRFPSKACAGHDGSTGHATLRRILRIPHLRELRAQVEVMSPRPRTPVRLDGPTGNRGRPFGSTKTTIRAIVSQLTGRAPFKTSPGFEHRGFYFSKQKAAATPQAGA